MGAFFTRFKKKPSTEEILVKLEKDINRTLEYKRTTEQTRKHLNGSLILYSVFVYAIVAVLFYFWYFPSALLDGILHSLPLFVFPLLVWILKQSLHWYFLVTIDEYENTLEELRRKKKQILNDVKETETFKVAKTLLQKFDPEISQKQMKSEEKVPASRRKGLQPTEMELRQRSAASRGISTVSPIRLSAVRPSHPAVQTCSPYSSFINLPHQNGQWRPSIPYPILPQQRTAVERIVDYLEGDGPTNRYALVCRRCNSHNGMALSEEFQYTGFHCCYCYLWNPPRKQRPKAPSLLEPICTSQKRVSESVDGTLSDTSGSCDDTEVESLIDDTEDTNFAEDDVEIKSWPAEDDDSGNWTESGNGGSCISGLKTDSESVMFTTTKKSD
ncbi:endoplasmic reticulum junction formation protein lunapark-A-like [Tachypleus tridentatus]|uniref:endoplasmic reticulum junction formation protein lunapark-A-like n=1 Tax=Tachypleus tridentatus TaxID=6853 RepID=UPI003FCF1408